MKVPQNTLRRFEELLGQARGGCPKALGELLDHCRGYLLAIANDRLDPKLQAKLGGSDLVQQTLMHAHREFVDFRGRTEGDLVAWLRQILVNESARAKRDYLETAKRDVSREVVLSDKPGTQGTWSCLPSDTQTPSKQAMARELDFQLDKALARLSVPYQKVIELRNRDQLTFAKIGAQMSISEERARRLWSRAIERLRQELALEAEC